MYEQKKSIYSYFPLLQLKSFDAGDKPNLLYSVEVWGLFYLNFKKLISKNSV